VDSADVPVLRDHGGRVWQLLKVDKQMRTSDPDVYAIGDIVGQPMLAHKSSREDLVVAAVIAGK
jgi:pyruvate/2-oxoglutarate dehydrogenase complex dihydrolipoamide dehydrogenase (E3) component